MIKNFYLKLVHNTQSVIRYMTNHFIFINSVSRTGILKYSKFIELLTLTTRKGLFTLQSSLFTYLIRMIILIVIINGTIIKIFS